jgi:flagellar assembly protein FliH
MMTSSNAPVASPPLDQSAAPAAAPARAGATPPPASPTSDNSPWVEQRTDRRAAFKSRNIPSPNEAARAGTYSRFIPREELNSFAAWSPGDLSGGPAPQANVQRAAEEPVRADIAALAATELRAARQAGYQDGYRDGLVALDGFKQTFALQTTTQIGTLIQSIGNELGSLQQDMARTLAISATHLARQIVRAELVARPELIANVAHEALDTMLLSAKHITLRVHPDDQPLVALGAAEVLAARGARLLADASISRGGCLVDSDIGVIDATLETRWRRAAASLGCEEDWSSAAPANDNVRADDDTKIDNPDDASSASGSSST